MSKAISKAFFLNINIYNAYVDVDVDVDVDAYVKSYWAARRGAQYRIPNPVLDWSYNEHPGSQT